MYQIWFNSDNTNHCSWLFTKQLIIRWSVEKKTSNILVPLTVSYFCFFLFSVGRWSYLPVPAWNMCGACDRKSRPEGQRWKTIMYVHCDRRSPALRPKKKNNNVPWYHKFVWLLFVFYVVIPRSANFSIASPAVAACTRRRASVRTRARARAHAHATIGP